MHITAVFANAKGARIVSSLRFSSIARCTRIFTFYVTHVRDRRANHLSLSVIQTLYEKFQGENMYAQFFTAILLANNFVSLCGSR